MKLRLSMSLLVGCILIPTTGLSARYTVIAPGVDFIPIVNQLNNGGNTLNEVLPNVPDGSEIFKWACTDYDFNQSYFYDAVGKTWRNANTGIPGGTLRPGEGALFFNGGATMLLTFTGTPVVPALPVSLLCTCGQLSFLGRQTDGIGTYENVTGLAPVEGAQVFRFDPATQYPGMPNTYSGGAWSQGAPTLLNIGESAFFSAGCADKWRQNPDTSTNGLDVAVRKDTFLADDFRCRATGPITEIRIWGSWLNDAKPFSPLSPASMLPFGTMCRLRAPITAIPVSSSAIIYSSPGNLPSACYTLMQMNAFSIPPFQPSSARTHKSGNTTLPGQAMRCRVTRPMGTFTGWVWG